MDGGAPASSRWTPTKEQINMLEGMYKQGIRTPSAEQIQQITNRLKVYGHIEGKNVFYWFQNHKARQRQKQKQENLAYNFNRYLQAHPNPSLFPPSPPCPNVVCSSYYMPQGDVAFYPQYRKLFVPGGIRMHPMPLADRAEKTMVAVVGSNPSIPTFHTTVHNNGNTNNFSDQETLPLFPLHPTGILQGGAAGSTTCQGPMLSCEDFPLTPNSCSSGRAAGEGDGREQPFFNFFSGRGSCENE